MVDETVVVNEPEEITELVNPHTGQTVVYYPGGHGYMMGWREKYPEEIERLLALHPQLMDEWGKHRNVERRYPLIKRVAFNRFEMDKLSDKDRQEYNHEYARWGFELQVAEVIKYFLRFIGECPNCKKFWKSGTSTKVTCLCGTSFELIDEGGLKIEFDDVYKKREAEFAAQYDQPEELDDHVDDEPDDSDVD